MQRIHLELHIYSCVYSATVGTLEAAANKVTHQSVDISTRSGMLAKILAGLEGPVPG